ncbi:hypothetical protein SAMN05216249_108106 [Acetitomaculum ruminis DSM 5522]|uniref:MBG domain-containing protein n=1 Tax=Acetitomaculum ruminis DSM 5522 TaxID=1120918 RepID=A0A1I0Y4Y7_9FIRM|nr:MBG domain-containing protein [Acetitomaculum ruminis]SFB07806.1 hypothetical protein SAMN05216249_108106 [Acetitomaculum ruminis DSM 5522]
MRKNFLKKTVAFAMATLILAESAGTFPNATLTAYANDDIGILTSDETITKDEQASYIADFNYDKVYNLDKTGENSCEVEYKQEGFALTGENGLVVVKKNEEAFYDYSINVSKDGEKILPDKGVIYDVGFYNLEIVVDGKIVATLEFTIKKNQVSEFVVDGNLNKTEDGNPIDLENIKARVKKQHNLDFENVDIKDLEFEYYNFSGDTKFDSAPTKPGEYSLKVIYPGNENYKSTYQFIWYKISEKPKENVTIQLQQVKKKIYDGTPIDASYFNVIINGEKQAIDEKKMELSFELLPEPDVKGKNLKAGKKRFVPVDAGGYLAVIHLYEDDTHAAAYGQTICVIDRAQTDSVEVKVEKREQFENFYDQLLVKIKEKDGEFVECKDRVKIDFYKDPEGKERVEEQLKTGELYYVKAMVPVDNNYYAASDLTKIILEKERMLDERLSIKPVNKLTYNKQPVSKKDFNVYFENRKLNEDEYTLTFNLPDGNLPTDAGDYEVEVSVDADDYTIMYNRATFTIKSAERKVEVKDKTVVYNNKVQKIDPALQDGKEITSGIEYTYFADENLEKPVTPKNAGTYFVKVISRDKNYYEFKTVVKLVIKKADAKIAFNTKSLTATYTGNAVKPQASVNSGEKVSFKYYKDAKCKKEIKAVDVKNVGTYYVVAVAKENENYKGVTSKAYKFVIKKQAAKLDLTATSKKTKVLSYTKLQKHDLKYAVKANGTYKEANKTKNITKGITFTKKGGDKKIIVSQDGKITVKKGLKKGNYKITITINFKGLANIDKKAVEKTITLKIK